MIVLSESDACFHRRCRLNLFSLMVRPMLTKTKKNRKKISKIYNFGKKCSGDMVDFASIHLMVSEKAIPTDVRTTDDGRWTPTS